MSNPIQTPEQLREMLFSFRLSRIVLTAFELDIFTAVEENGDPIVVAARVGADRRGVDRLLRALAAMGLLHEKGEGFVNGELARRCLVKGSPEYMAGIGHSLNLWQSWSTLTDAVRRGGTVLERPLRRRSSEALDGFIAAMHERASQQAPRMIAMLDLQGVRRALDIGGGSGAYAMALARAVPGLRAVVFDVPEVLPLTRRYVEAAGLAESISFLAGDFHVDDFGDDYDLILLSAIVHMNSPQENRSLLRRAAAHLRPGGQIVIQDFIMTENRIQPEVGAFFALNMLVGTAAGDSFTAAEIDDWLREAGLTRIEQRATPFDASLMIGWKE